MNLSRCTSTLEIADDDGDSHATMKCDLESGHSESHREKYGRVTVYWLDPIDPETPFVEILEDGTVKTTQ